VPAKFLFNVQIRRFFLRRGSQVSSQVHFVGVHSCSYSFDAGLPVTQLILKPVQSWLRALLSLPYALRSLECPLLNIGAGWSGHVSQSDNLEI
jgi:hypothetical protein